MKPGSPGISLVFSKTTRTFNAWVNFTGIRSYSGYGMTEMASTVFAKQSDGKVGVGQPLLGRAFKLVNEEVWLKGAGLAMGYWREGHIVPLTKCRRLVPNKR